MKKILTLLSAFAVTASTSATIVACDKGKTPSENEPPILEGKTLEELKAMLEEKKEAIKIEPICSKEAFDWLKEEGFEKFIEYHDGEGPVIKDDLSEEDHQRVAKEFANFSRNSNFSYNYQASFIDWLELNYQIYLKDDTFETRITTSKILIEEVEKWIEEHKEGEEAYGYDYLHKSIEKYAQKIINRNR